MFSLQNKFFTVDTGSLYRHYDESTTDNRGSFYGVKYPATVQFVFNDNPQVQKNFQTINYEGNSGWEVTSMISDGDGQIRYTSTDPWFISSLEINQGSVEVYLICPSPSEIIDVTSQPLFPS